MNWNCPVSVGDLVRYKLAGGSVSEGTAKSSSKKTSTSNRMKTGYLAMTVFAAAIGASYFAVPAHAATGLSAQAASENVSVERSIEIYTARCH